MFIVGMIKKASLALVAIMVSIAIYRIDPNKKNEMKPTKAL